ncbi:MAG: 30S ribosomal protein S30e [Desulfurococcales archaeon]|nr:30S ribosomal protein S30e [Desulfurococcales archaeon]
MPSHGSLTKAGRVRELTPKIEPKPKKNKPPRIRNRIKYTVRVIQAASQQGRRRRRF